MGSKVDANGCSEEQRGVLKAAAVVPQAMTPAPTPPPAAPEPALGEKGQELAKTGRIRLDNLYFDREPSFPGRGDGRERAQPPDGGAHER